MAILLQDAVEAHVVEMEIRKAVDDEAEHEQDKSRG